MDKEREWQLSQRMQEAFQNQLRGIREMMAKDGSLSDDEWLEIAEYIRDQVTFKWAVAATKATIMKKKAHVDPESGKAEIVNEWENEVCKAPGLSLLGSAVQDALRAILAHLQCVETKKRTLGMNTPAQEIVNVSAEDRDEFRSRGLRLVSGKNKGE